VWLGDNRISPVSSGSVDQANVSLDRGEMSFGLFEYDSKISELTKRNEDPIRLLKSMQDRIGKASLPDYLIRYVQQTTTDARKQIAIHEPTSIAQYKDAEGLDKNKIERRRGFFGRSQQQKFPNAVHHFAVFHNGKNVGRMIYKFVGNIHFIKNLKHV